MFVKNTGMSSSAEAFAAAATRRTKEHRGGGEDRGSLELKRKPSERRENRKDLCFLKRPGVKGHTTKGPHPPDFNDPSQRERCGNPVSIQCLGSPTSHQVLHQGEENLLLSWTPTVEHRYGANRWSVTSAETLQPNPISETRGDIQEIFSPFTDRNSHKRFRGTNVSPCAFPTEEPPKQFYRETIIHQLTRDTLQSITRWESSPERSFWSPWLNRNLCFPADELWCSSLQCEC